MSAHHQVRVLAEGYRVAIAAIADPPLLACGAKRVGGSRVVGDQSGRCHGQIRRRLRDGHVFAQDRVDNVVGLT